MSRKKKEAEREERRKKVAANLKAGLNYRQMAEVLNVSIGTISNDVEIILGRWKREMVEEAGDWITLELARIDQALNAIWEDITSGNTKAIETMLKLMERRAKFLGTDKPQKFAPTNPSGDKEYSGLSDEERKLLKQMPPTEILQKYREQFQTNGKH